MVQRSQIEQLLKINGVAVTAPDEEIKSVLLSARWHEKDVETAMLVLRENTKSHETHVDTLHKLFQSDEKLRPETITALLGIDILLPKGSVNTKGKKINASLGIGQGIQIACVSIVLALLCVVGSMWYLHVGLFHIALR